MLRVLLAAVKCCFCEDQPEMRAHLALRYMAALVIITAMMLDNDMFVALPDSRSTSLKTVLSRLGNFAEKHHL